MSNKTALIAILAITSLLGQLSRAENCEDMLSLRSFEEHFVANFGGQCGSACIIDALQLVRVRMGHPLIEDPRNEYTEIQKQEIAYGVEAFKGLRSRNFVNALQRAFNRHKILATVSGVTIRKYEAQPGAWPAAPLKVVSEIPLEIIPSSRNKINFLRVEQHRADMKKTERGKLKEHIYGVTGAHWVIAGDDDSSFFVVDPGWLQNKKGLRNAILSSGKSPEAEYRRQNLPRLDFHNIFVDGKYVWFITDVVTLDLGKE